MHFRFVLQISVTLIFCTCARLSLAQTSHSEKALDFIFSLTDNQKEEVLYPFYDMAPHGWSYLPASMYFADGMAMKDFDPAQKEKLTELLKDFLSDKGYSRTQTIMSLEYVLRDLEPENPNRIPENYLMAIYGVPHPDSTWGWMFSGHHVVLNFTIVKNKVAFSPFFFGSNPAEVREGPQKGKRAIAGEEDIAFELMSLFTREQRQKAIFQKEAYLEIVTSNATEVGPLPDVGIAVMEMTSEQKTVLSRLLTAYLSSMPEDLAEQRLRNIQAEDFQSVHFGWAGSTVKGEPHYYRIEGKSFLVEFDNTQNHANHIHFVWRDFNGDFGRDLLKEHYLNAHKH